ncbi:TetR/AcrR family transcriptional regulator [Microterricola viridarii]|uniref:DNA-binding transcriptional regulator, AcrR family n=1 Tax=Microterricola viridarii TaxID=412690 RepID=A0A1H1WGY4_9MICO|nr:TetR/AcrR family transcriptional regulator [Microterricola viridarii]SDS95910.1 DNA-binding transcriptional regulator, AcrR family [Microterricola viridarii]
MIGRPRATTHWAIRDTAIELFIQDGYAETSLARIAKECGISRTTLFSYFPAKADMIVYGEERNFERLRDVLADAPYDIPAGTVLAQAARTMRPLPSNAREELTLFWALLEENADVAAQSARYGHRYRTVIEEFVVQRLGTDPDDPMPAVFSATMSAAMYAAAQHWTSHAEGEASLEDALERAVAPLIEAYLGER